MTAEKKNIRSQQKMKSLLFFGSPCIIGTVKDSKLNIEELWSMKFGAIVFRATMSEQWFWYLLYVLRIDDKTMCAVRDLYDNLAAIWEVWDQFINNCTWSYNPPQNLTGDKQLVSFFGNSQFRMYIPWKLAKYGMKIVMINDNSTSYMFSMIPYLTLSKRERLV